jgi:catechol-2,3-dioxygenase
VATQAVLYVPGLEPLAAFYQDCIGLTLAQRGDGYYKLRADGLVLWLVRGQRLAATDARRDATDPEGNVIQLLEPL